MIHFDRTVKQGRIGPDLLHLVIELLGRGDTADPDQQQEKDLFTRHLHK
jgi:hypothetical protein